MQQGSQTIATYGYDIQNRRFRKTVGSTTTYYLYNLDDQLIAEISGAGTVHREYVWLDGEPFLLAEYTGTSAGMYFYVNDHLGTPPQLLNGETGAVAWQAAYLLFGVKGHHICGHSNKRIHRKSSDFERLKRNLSESIAL